MLPFPVHLPSLQSKHNINPAFADNSSREDTPIEYQFSQMPYKDAPRHQQYVIKSVQNQEQQSTIIRKNSKSPYQSNIQVIKEIVPYKQRRFVSEVKMKAEPINIISNSKPKKKGTGFRPCGNEKCQICKKVKLKKSKDHLTYLSRVKTKSVLPQFPRINNSQVGKSNRQKRNIFNQAEEDQIGSINTKSQKNKNVYIGQMNNNRFNVVRSVLSRYNEQRERQIERQVQLLQSRYNIPSKSNEYRYSIQPSQGENFYNKQFINQRRRYFTEASEPEKKQPKYLPKIMNINGKLYEIVSEEMVEKNNNLSFVDVESLMPRSLLRQRKQAEEISNWQKKRERERIQREQLNRKVQQFIKKETMFYIFHKQSQNLQQENMRYTKNQSIFYTSSQKQSKYQDGYRKYYTKKKQVLLPSESIEEQKTQIYNIKFPSLSQIQQRINNYQSLTGQIDIDSMKKSPDYIRQYSLQQGKQFLYFGGYDHFAKKRKGLGVYVNKKIILEGIWSEGYIMKGVQLRPNSLYKGEFKNNKKCGEGSCKWLNGQEYLGQWEGGLRNGHGFWSSKGGAQTYSGEWKNGKVCGYGQYYKRNYSTFKGRFENFIKFGQGNEQFENGDKFQGQYMNGFPEGMGQYKWNCGLVFKGQFRKGLRIGKGNLASQAVFELSSPFDRERPHGIGQLRLNNGDLFNGKYVFGQKYGFGKLQYGGSNKIQEGFWNHGVLESRIE